MKRISKHDKIEIDFTPQLAEIIGILLGDGGFYWYAKGKRYYIVFVFNKNELSYLRYVNKLLSSYFFPYLFTSFEAKNEYKLTNNSNRVGEVLLSVGIMLGNKIQNNVSIPEWIFDKNFLKEAIRGIFDTDGCVYKKYANYAQIQFKFASYSLISSLREALLCLNFNPTKIQKEIRPDGRVDYKIYLSRQNEIKKFFEEINPCNTKHIERYGKIKNGDGGI